jgi:hypothetical protein
VELVGSTSRPAPARILLARIWELCPRGSIVHNSATLTYNGSFSSRYLRIAVNGSRMWTTARLCFTSDKRNSSSCASVISDLEVYFGEIAAMLEVRPSTSLTLGDIQRQRFACRLLLGSLFLDIFLPSTL